MEIVSGFQRTQATGRLNAFLATLPHMEILPFEGAIAPVPAIMRPLRPFSSL